MVTYSQEPQWKKIPTPVDVTLRNLSFTDSLNGWAAGESGTILHTTDGGLSWEIQNSTVTSFIIDIFFLNGNTGWALTIKEVFPFNTIILRTTNSGSDWTIEDYQDSTALMRTIFFFDQLNGFIGGSYIAYTTDGGSSWFEAEVDSNMISGYPVYKFRFLNRQFGYACGGVLDNAGVIWRTTNYGKNWSVAGVSADQVFDLFIFDSLNAITLSGDPEGFFETAKIKTSDAGLSWISEALPFYGLCFAIDFRTWNEGWAASGYKFLFTSDRGDTWNELDTPDSSVIFDLQFTDARNGFAAGTDGVILKLDPTTVNVKREDHSPKGFYLYQNYPNPFNPTTKISWQVPVGSLPDGKAGWQTLKIFDILGNEVATLVDEYKPAGSYDVEFNVAQVSRPELASGVYFYQLKIGDPRSSSGYYIIQTKKMVYLK